jgi:hypothetical protein
MNHHLRAPCAAVLCAAALASHIAQAQNIYKCTLDGKVSYGDTPCASGAATASTLAVPVASAAPLADPAAAADLQRLKKESVAIEKARQKVEEREARDAERAARAASAQRKRCAKLVLAKQWAEEDVRGATAANVDKARLRAKRAGETLSVECPR